MPIWAGTSGNRDAVTQQAGIDLLIRLLSLARSDITILSCFVKVCGRAKHPSWGCCQHLL
jgi:hypothetical protein